MKEPLFLIKFYKLGHRNGKFSEPEYTTVNSEDEILEFIKKLTHNYWVYSIGGLYKNKEYFQNILKSREVDKDRQKYEELKKKFENGD